MPASFCVLALTLAFAVAAPQARVSFAGQWVNVDSTVNPVGNLVGVVGARDMTITQDASVLKIDRPYGSNRATVVIKLDSSPSTNVLDTGPGRGANTWQKRELVSRAEWDGAKLKITTVVEPPVPDGRGPAQKVTTIETLSLDGDNLIVERSDEAMGAPPGRAPLRPGMIQARKMIYTRAK